MENARLLQEDQVQLLRHNFSNATLTLIENELKALKTSKNNLRYSEDLKAFAVSLHFYSAQAYNYVRRFLNLPHPDTIRKWAMSVNVEPGFFGDVFHSLKEQLSKEKEMKDVAIMFDAMSIRKQVLYETKSGKYSGYVNHGSLMIDSPDTLASEALTFLVVGLKRFFKCPIGYFLIDKISAKQQAQLVEHAIAYLSECGFTVQAVVCDGAFCNQATALSLGCRISATEIDTRITTSSSECRTPINFVFDACHLIKNVRNCLGDMKVLYSGEQRIEWKYIEELHKLQLASNTHLANKLRGKHIDFAKNKMNVSLAAQTLSASVVTAIEFLRDELKLPQFIGSEATCTFIAMFNKMFDICNSMTPTAPGLKSAMTPNNIKFKTELMHEAANYIRTLREPCGKSLLEGRRKTGFIGFLATLHSLEAIGKRLISDGYRFLLTYRLSQDHLETLFGRIRRRGGWNNNPNALQFKYAIRALLQKNGVQASDRGNCKEFMPPGEVDTTIFLDSCQPEPESREGKMMALLRTKGPYHNHVLHYIAGFIIKKLEERVKCPECHSLLMGRSPDDTFTVMRDKGGLRHPSTDVLKIVKQADHALRQVLVSQGTLRLVSSVTTKKVSLLVTEALGHVAFESHPHFCHNISEDSHPVQLIKEICSLFCKTFLHHNGKVFTDRLVNANEGSLRHKLSKTILFMHQ